MGRGACKTSHLGKNTLKNRRFLESNNADSGERVRGLPESGAGLWLRCRRGAESENRLASPAVCRPVSAAGTAVSSLFTQHPLPALRKLASALVRNGAQLAPTGIGSCFRLCPPLLGSPSNLLAAQSSLPFEAQLRHHLLPRPFSPRPLALSSSQLVLHTAPLCSPGSQTAVFL